MAAATLVGAQADAMKAAAANDAGAMTGFMGLGMAANAGGTNAQNLYSMGQQERSAAQTEQPPATVQNNWSCAACGAVSNGNFCRECGSKKPDTDWKCTACGAVYSARTAALRSRTARLYTAVINAAGSRRILRILPSFALNAETGLTKTI